MSLPAINPMMGLYGNPYLMSMQGSQNLYNDPYFMMALNSPNMFNSIWANQANAVAQKNSTSAASQDTSKTREEAPVEKKNRRAGKVLAVLSVLALAGAGFIGHKRGPVTEKSFWKRIWKGLVSTAESGKNKLMPKAPTVATIDGKTVVKIPGKKNIIGKAEELEKIGETFNVEKASEIFKDGKFEQGYRYSNFAYKIPSGSDANTIVCAIGKDGGIRTVLYDLNGNIIPRCDNNKELFSQVDSIVKDVRNGKIGLDQLDKATVVHTNSKTGLVSRIKYSRPEGSTELNGQFSSAVTDRLPINHDYVQAYRYNHSGFNQFLTDYEKGTAKKKIANAEYTTGIGTFTLEGDSGNVVNLRTGNETFAANSDGYSNIAFNNQTIINGIPDKKNEWTNIWYKSTAA